MARPGGLGRGLAALIPVATPGTSGLLEVPLDVLVPNPRQPRGHFEDGPLQDLAQSLRQVGMLQPIVVRPSADGRYEIVAGERRYRAARIADFTRVPVVVRHTADAALLTEALVENIHRADLTPLEEAAAYDQLLHDFGMTHEELAARLGRSRSAITNTLRLLALAPLVQRRLTEGTVSAGHARALLGISDHERQEQVAGTVVAEGLSVRSTEDLVRETLSRPTRAEDGMAQVAAAAPRRSRSAFTGLEERVADVLSTRVRITGTERRGAMVIDFAGAEDLQRLLEILGRGAGTDLTRE